MKKAQASGTSRTTTRLECVGATRTSALGLIIASALLSSACSRTPTLSQPSYLNGPNQILSEDIEPTAAQVSDTTDPSSDIIFRQTFAGKILTAIALERVTGRKPDPARLSELY